MVAITKQLAPRKRTTRGLKNKRRTIAIHETANTGRGAGAQSHANLQSRVNPRKASWHYQVDDKVIIQSFEDTVRCWHAGSKANKEAISIEICVNSDSDYDKALENAAALVAHLRKKHGIPANRIVSHKWYTGKDCPRIMLGAGRWDEFVAATNPSGNATIKTSASKPKASPKPSSSGKSVATMASEVIAGRHGSGHANRQRSLGVNNATYAAVRNEVNRRAGVSTPKASSGASSKSVSTMATEVIAGKHGSGHSNRQRSLGVSSSVYAQVRNEVNRRAGVRTPARRAGKSVSQMATEVIQGKHGNGHANRQRSLGVNNTTYAAVRKEVNRRS